MAVASCLRFEVAAIRATKPLTALLPEQQSDGFPLQFVLKDLKQNCEHSTRIEKVLLQYWHRQSGTLPLPASGIGIHNDL